MKRLLCAVALSALAVGARPMAAQNTKAIEQAVTAVATDWNNAWNKHDAGAVAALFDSKPVGLIIIGGTTYPVDSMRAVNQRYMSQRTNEAWTVDRAQVIVLSDNSALLQITFSGHFTLATGITWEYKSSAFVTALVQKRGSAWKITAFQNSASGTQVKK